MGKKSTSKKKKTEDFGAIEKKSVIGLKVGDIVMPIGIKVGRSLYRVCPVCGAIMSTATGWRKHMQKYHKEFLESVEKARRLELISIIKTLKSSIVEKEEEEEEETPKVSPEKRKELMRRWIEWQKRR